MPAAVDTSTKSNSRRLFSDDDILHVLTFAPQPTSSICSKLGCSRDTATRHLKRLAREDKIEMLWVKSNTNIGKIYMWKKHGFIEEGAVNRFEMCKQCRTLKPKNEFYTIHGKHTLRCKECTKENVKRRRTLKKLYELLDLKESELLVFNGSSFDDNLNMYLTTQKEIASIKAKLRRIENWHSIRDTERIYGTKTAGKITKRKANSKRRDLGFNPINEYFKGSEYHHLRYDANGNKDDDVGIFIPKKLHRSVNHNGNTGHGMDKINKIALDWYNSQGVSL